MLAPDAELRARVVPQGLPAQEQATTEAAARAECEVETVQARLHRVGWARLLKRVFDIDVQHCPRCGAGDLKIIAAILERAVIGKILTHLGLDPQPPPRRKAREAEHGFGTRVAGARAGPRLVACSGWRAAWGALLAMCATCPRLPPSPGARPESHAVNACSLLGDSARWVRRADFVS